MSHVISESHISQPTASDMVAAAVEHARAEGLQVCVAVVDHSGRLKAFAQMDGAPRVAEEGSLRKARTALLGLPSGVLGTAMEDSLPALLSFTSLPDTAFLGGGIPIVVAGELVGAIGVGGAITTEQDEACANAGLSVLN